MKKYWMVIILWGLLRIAQAELSVTNFAVVQQEGTKQMVLSYDLFSTRTNAVTVNVSISNNMEVVNSSSMVGDIGTGVVVGVNREIIWDMATDWNGEVANLTYVISVDDGLSSFINVMKTGQTNSYLVGDDGDLQRGITPPNPRFVDNGDGTVLDSLTGLMWITEPHAVSGNSDSLDWTNAISFCNGLEFAGYDDWVLPNVRELETLVNCGKGSWGDRTSEWLNSEELPFSGIYPQLYWTSTTYFMNNTYAWSVALGTGEIDKAEKSQSHYAWPVRSGQVE
jgi:hypothetical protein